MVSIAHESLSNLVRDWFYDLWSGIWDQVLERSWKTRNLPRIQKELQRSLFELSLDGQRILEGENLEKLPAIFQAVEALDNEFKASDELKKRLDTYRRDFIRWLYRHSTQQEELGLLRDVLSSFQDPRFSLELDLEEQKLDDPEHPGRLLRLKIVPRKQLAMVVSRLRRGWRIVFRHDDEILRDKEGREIEAEIKISGKSLSKIYAHLSQLYAEFPKKYPDLYTGEEAWIPYKIIRKDGEEYLRLRLVRPRSANVLVTLVPSKDLFEKWLRSMDLFVLQKLWLSPISRTLPLGPIGPYQEVNHWFIKTRDLPEDKQITVAEAINKFLGSKIFDEKSISREQLANLADYFIASKVPLLFLRVDRNLLDAVLALYASKGSVINIESQELKIKPASVKFEMDKDKIYRKVEEGKEIIPEFVADPSLDKKKMIMYKLTFQLADGSKKSFFMLRLTGRGSKDTLYIGRLAKESLSSESS